MGRASVALACLIGTLAGVAMADEVTFNNGDKLSGKIATVDAGKMKITGTVAGDITVDMTNVASFKTDEPAVIRTSDGKETSGNVSGIEDGKIKVAGGEEVPVAQVAKINPAPEKWTGTVTVAGSLARGNTHSEDLTVIANAVLRRESNHNNDRFTLDASYAYGRQRDADGNDSTSTDNWLGAGKYDLFLDPKFYVYGNLKVEHDRIARLDYRVTPGVGVGYQWVEKPELNFYTEAGISYVYENYIDDATNQYVGLRLAYHFDKKLNDAVSLFHDLEFLPAFEDPSDYNLNADVGVRAKLVGAFYTEFRIDFKRDSTPAAGAEKNDIKYVLGLGMQF